MTLQAALDRRVFCIACGGACVDDDVDRWELMLVMSKRFAYQALQAISPDSAANVPSGDRQSQAGLRAVISAKEDYEQSIGGTSRILVDAIEIRFFMKTLRRRERSRTSLQVTLR